MKTGHKTLEIALSALLNPTGCTDGVGDTAAGETDAETPEDAGGPAYYPEIPYPACTIPG